MSLTPTQTAHCSFRREMIMPVEDWMRVVDNLEECSATSHCDRMLGSSGSLSSKEVAELVVTVMPRGWEGRGLFFGGNILVL